MERKIYRAISMPVVVLFTIAVIFTGLLRNDFIQTYLARVTAIHLSEYLNIQVKIEKLKVSAFFRIDVVGVEINDLQNKPLIYLKNLYLSADLFNVFGSNFALNNLQADSANIFIRKYTGSDTLNILCLLNKFMQPDSIRADTSIKPQDVFVFKLNHLELINSRFVYQIEDSIRLDEFGIDYLDLDIQDIDISLKNISLYNDSLNMEIQHLSVSEKSGFRLNHFEGDLSISNKGMQLKYAFIETPNSTLELNLSFTYSNWDSYSQFVDDINLRGEIFEGRMNTSDIAFFAPAMQGMNNPFKMIGTFNGPVRNLRARNILLSVGNETEFRGNIQMTGLPNIFETFISLRIHDFSTSINDIQQFQLPGGYVFDQLPEAVYALGNIEIQGNFTGFYNNFVSNANFSSGIGQLATDIKFSNNPEQDIIEYRGDFHASSFNLGGLLMQQEYFGMVDFDMKVEGKGLDMESLYANVEGKINSLQFKDKQLNDIAINGLFQEKQFTGDININDELIRADFQGHINFDTLVPIFNFNLKLDNTHLALLGLLPVDSSVVLASNIKMNFSGNTIDNIRGEIRLDSTNLFYKNELYLIKSIRMSATSNSDNYRTIRLNSDFVDGDINGEFLLSELKNTGILFLHNYLPNLFSDSALDLRLYTKNVIWDIRFKDLSHILPLFDKSLQVSKNGFWGGNFDAENNELSSQFNLQNAVYQGVKFNNLQLKIYNNNKGLNADLLMDAFIFKEQLENDTLQLSIDNFRFSSLANNDSIQFLVNWKNKFNAIKNKGDIAGFANLNQTPNIDIKLKYADLIINDSIWVINPQNCFRIGENGILFDKFDYRSGNQLVEIIGGIDSQSEQALTINFNNFNISNFDILLNYKGIDLDGFINGDMQFIDVFQNIDFLADLQLNDLKVNKEIIGNVILNSKRNMDKSIFINAEIEKSLDNKQTQKPLVFQGFYFPDKYENSLDFSLYLNQLPAQVVSPFLYQYVDRFKGNVSGNVLIGGQLNKPDLSGNIQFDTVAFRIIYLNTEYKLIANAEIDNYSIILRNAFLLDKMNKKAPVFGGLYHNHLKDFGLDLSILPSGFMGLNTRKGMNALFYGKAFVNGSVEINGPFDDVSLEIVLESGKGSELVIPISLTADLSDNEFITFENPKKTGSDKPEKKQIVKPSSFSLNMELAITPNASVDIILPTDLGNIQAVGFGDLNMNLNRDGNFTMAGDYRVNKGTFLFAIKNVYKKRFDLVDGGTISWTGDPYAGEINMKAIYHVKTSLSTLGETQDSSFKARVPVDCIIGLSDQILNPTVKFGFEFPNSPEEVRQLVFSQIDTTNEAEMSQQMLSLLVLNSFSFSSATGNETFASGLGGSSLQFVANQLGSWLSQINPNLDVGINYRPSGAITNEEVEVALSTQLFNNRVTLETNFGTQNLDKLSNSNTSSIVGDINVEYKITEDGRIRLKAFNRTNTVDLFDNIAPYTQGVGVFYRKEFNYFKELFRKKKEKKMGTEVEPDKIVPDIVQTTETDNNILVKNKVSSQ